MENTQTQPNTPFNQGKPLSPQQIREFRQKMNINPTAGNTSPSAQTNVASQWAKYDQMKAGGSTAEKPGEEPVDEHRNIIQKALGVVFDPVAKFGTHVGELAGLGIAEGASALTGNKDYAKRAEEYIGRDRRIPVVGTHEEGLTSPGQAAKQVAGEGIGSLAMAVGSPAAGGALLGLGQGLESDKGAGGVAVDTIAGALGGKVLELGFGTVAPYISKGIEKYGMPLYEKIEQYVPENAKAALKAVAEKITPRAEAVGEKSALQKGADKFTETVEKPFRKAGEKIGEMRSKTEQQSFDSSIEAAKSKLNPTGKYTPGEKWDMLGDQTKIKRRGIFKRDVPETPVTGETEAVAELHGMRDENGKSVLPESNTPGQDIQTIKQHAERHDQNIDEFLAEPRNNVPFTTKSSDRMFDGVVTQAQKDRVFLSDSSEEKAYRDVIQVAKEELGGVKKNMAGMRTAVKKFNQRMEEILGKDVYTEGGTPTTVGKARLQAAKDVRKGMNDFIQQALNESGAAKSVRFSNPEQARGLIGRAKNFSSPEEFIDAMKTEGSASGAEQKFAEKTGTANEGAAGSTVSESGLNVNDRSGSASYKTTPDQDLEEIWHMAHTDISSTKGDVFKASLRKEAQLLSAANEIKNRAGDTLGKSKVERFLASPKGKIVGKALRLAGYGLIYEGGHYVVKGDF